MICTQQHLFFLVLIPLPRKLLLLRPHLCKCCTTSRPDTNVSPKGSCPMPQPEWPLSSDFITFFYFHYRFYRRLHEMAICACVFFSHIILRNIRGQSQGEFLNSISYHNTMHALPKYLLNWKSKGLLLQTIPFNTFG